MQDRLVSFRTMNPRNLSEDSPKKDFNGFIFRLCCRNLSKTARRWVSALDCIFVLCNMSLKILVMALWGFVRTITRIGNGFHPKKSLDMRKGKEERLVRRQHRRKEIIAAKEARQLRKEARERKRTYDIHPKPIASREAPPTPLGRSCQIFWEYPGEEE